jgi:hypothetical protein
MRTMPFAQNRHSRNNGRNQPKLRESSPPVFRKKRRRDNRRDNHQRRVGHLFIPITECQEPEYGSQRCHQRSGIQRAKSYDRISRISRCGSVCRVLRSCSTNVDHDRAGTRAAISIRSKMIAGSFFRAKPRTGAAQLAVGEGERLEDGETANAVRWRVLWVATIVRRRL